MISLYFFYRLSGSSFVRYSNCLIRSTQQLVDDNSLFCCHCVYSWVQIRASRLMSLCQLYYLHSSHSGYIVRFGLFFFINDEANGKLSLTTRYSPYLQPGLPHILKTICDPHLYLCHCKVNYLEALSLPMLVPNLSTTHAVVFLLSPFTLRSAGVALTWTYYSSYPSARVHVNDPVVMGLHVTHCSVGDVALILK